MRISNIDKLLLLGIILAPMTGFRIWKVGPSELLVFLWCILNIRSIFKLKWSNYNVKFWLLFIILIILGTMFGVINYPNQVVVSQLITWFYIMFISIFIYSGLRIKPLDYAEELLKRIVIFGTLWYFFLFIYSLFVSSNFFGAPLWYGSGARFSGGATNPHQIAVAIGAYLFISIRYAIKSETKVNKISYIVLAILALMMGIATKSSTLIMALVLSSAFLIFIYLVKLSKSRYYTLASIFLLISILTTVMYIKFDSIYSFIFGWIESDPNGVGRLIIYSTISDTLEKNALFGLGPGIHAGFGNYEYHNTYLEIIAMSGILGIILYFIYSFKIYKIIKNDKLFLAAVSSLYIYGFAGFAMRRLVFWAFLMIILVIAEKYWNNMDKSIEKNISLKGVNKSL